MRLTDKKVIEELSRRHGFRFSKKMGQNFLIEEWVPEGIAEASGAGQGTCVFEIGPGIGCLTVELAKLADKVVTIEKDTALKPLLGETIGGNKKIKLIFEDAMKLNFPQLVKTEAEGLRPILCANLPYNITTPLLSILIDSASFESMTVMLQKEVIDRICATPNSAEYGAFSLYVNWHCEAVRLFEVPSDCFMPRPKVHSGVLKLIPRKEPPFSVKDEALMRRVVRAAFSQRRKTLENALANGIKDLDKAATAAAIAECGLEAKVRGEELSMQQFAFLSDILENKLR